MKQPTPTLRRIRRHTRSSERGQTLVLFALAAVALIAFVALGIDLVRLYDARSEAQNAADHAVTTASHAICRLHKTEADAVADGYAIAGANGFDTASTTHAITVTPNGGTRFTAVATRTIDTSFAAVIGWQTLDAAATAVGDCTSGGAGSTGAIYAGGDCENGKWSLDMSGQDAEVIGGVHANGDVSIASNQADYFRNEPATPPADVFEYVGILKPDSTSGNFFDAGYPAPVAMPSPQWPSGWDPADVTGGAGDPPTAGSLLRNYYDLADANGTTDADDTLFNVKVTAITKDGVYYTTSNEGMDVTVIAGSVRNVVLVAPNGPIKVSVSTPGQVMNAITDAQLDAIADIPTSLDLPREGILMLSNKTYADPVDRCGNFTINISGQNASWNGIVWAPGGIIEFAGSDDNAVKGSLVGWAVKTSGHNISIRFDPDLFDGTPEVLLLE